MKESTKTKKALRGSLFALFLCIVLLIGTTFAWFTDTASTGVNKIQAGNLKVGLQYSTDGGDIWADAKDATTLFDQNALWEPGHVEYVNLKVSNLGNLALKYQMGINIASETQGKNVNNETFKLSDYLKMAVVDGATKYDTREAALTAAAGGGTLADYTKDGTLAPQGKATQELKDSNEVTVIVYMPETVGNEANAIDAQHAASIDLGINVVATQTPYESDSFNDQYDAKAAYPVVVKNQESLNNAITNASGKMVNVEIPSGTTLTLDNDIANGDVKSRNVTITGNGDTSVVDVITNTVNAEGGQLSYQRGSTFTFENLKIQAGEGSFDGIVCDELVFRNCKITGKLTLYGKATFINCTFDNTMANQYSIWTWGGTDVNFDKCTFNTNGKAILLYGQATAAKPTNLTVNNCTFNDRKSGAAGKAAIEIGNDYKATYNLVINKATVNGFAINAEGANTNSTLWANKNSMDAEHLSVTIDGTKIQ